MSSIVLPPLFFFLTLNPTFTLLFFSVVSEFIFVGMVDNTKILLLYTSQSLTNNVTTHTRTDTGTNERTNTGTNTRTNGSSHTGTDPGTHEHSHPSTHTTTESSTDTAAESATHAAALPPSVETTRDTGSHPVGHPRTDGVTATVLCTDADVYRWYVRSIFTTTL